MALVCASENGIKVTVDDAKCIIAHAYVPADLFRHFFLKEKEVVFRVNLTVLLVSLILDEYIIDIGLSDIS